MSGAAMGPGSFKVLLIVVGLLALAGRPVAHAAPRLMVRWQAPAHCPRGAVFDAELARVGGQGAVTALVQVTELVGGARRYQLDLQLTAEGHTSERRLALAGCDDVQHAAALLIATALQASEASDPAPPTAASPGWQVRLGGLTDLYTLPAFTAGPELGVAWSWSRLQLMLDARYLLPREARDDTSLLRADLDLLAGSMAAAYLGTLDVWRIGPVVGVEVGVLSARARGEQARSRRTGWLAAWVGGLLDVALSPRFGLLICAALSAPLRRPAFSLADEPPFYETRALAFRVGIGVRVWLGSTNPGPAGQ